MSETLEITYDDLRREIGRFAGYGRTASAWTTEQTQDVAGILKNGLRKFYWPFVPERTPANQVAGDNFKTMTRARHAWSFLRQTGTLALAAATSTYSLPDDFAGNMAGVTMPASSGLSRLDVASEDQIRTLQSTKPLSGSPKYYAVRVKPNSYGGRTRYEVLFYPTPDTALTITFRYLLNPFAVDSTNQYALGGAQHGETIIEACLAAFEEKLNDNEGVHCKKFLECLQASVQIDKDAYGLQENEEAEIWPVDFAANGLTINRAYLKRLIGPILGHGPNAANWTHRQAEEVNLALQTGLRKFYHPQPVSGEKYGYQWGFLCPLGQLDFQAEQFSYDLPDNFAMLDGELTYARDESVLLPKVKVVGEQQIRVCLQSDTGTGRPLYAAVAPKQLTGVGTRYELLVWPVPDGSYQVQYRYQINPTAGTEEAEVPHGGQPHAQTIIEACCAAAEEQIGKRGMHSQLFMECLAKSVSHDRQASSAKTLGYNGDSSDWDNWNGDPLLQQDVLTPYNGTYY